MEAIWALKDYLKTEIFLQLSLEIDSLRLIIRTFLLKTIRACINQDHLIASWMIYL